MSLSKFVTLLASVTSLVSAYNPQLAFSSPVEVETRTIDEIYQAALKEGGTLTVWHGGDEENQQDFLKTAFEARFPGMTLNIIVDLSKYHNVNLDRQLATNSVYVDSIILQTLNDFPRWKEEDALLPYKPLGYENQSLISVYDKFKDSDGVFMGLFVISWSETWNSNYINASSAPKEYTGLLKPEFKEKLVLTYPNDDDAVLYQFDLILKKYGYSWFEALLAQNPRWVRGTAIPATLVGTSIGTYTATFTSSVGLQQSPPLNVSFPTDGTFVSWPQTGAILKDEPYPESAKLLHSWMLSLERQNGGWSTWRDATPPTGYPGIMEMNGMDPTKFSEWMMDRAAVERLRFLFEDRIGSAQGLSPLIDG
ncbi:periplasmic binding protein-like II [Acephala macrosclerotiorum]|nr:periplasmic binding protein-like II [Acephala macrosclerotiorum]